MLFDHIHGEAIVTAAVGKLRNLYLILLDRDRRTFSNRRKYLDSTQRISALFTICVISTLYGEKIDFIKYGQLF